MPEEKLIATVSNLFKRLDYSPELREYIAVGRRLELIEEQHSDRQLSDETEYDDLRERFKELHGEVKPELEKLRYSELPDVSIEV